MADRRVLLYNGETFEFDIMDKLQAEFPGVKLLHDLKIYSQYLKKDTQIDIVAVTSTGVFVIEAKNWKYWVSGDYGDYTWTGKSRDNHIITTFNPIHQNFIHIRALRNSLRNYGYEPEIFHNLVVVPDGTAIKSPCEEVLNLSRVPRYIREMSNEHIDVNKCIKSIKAVTA